MPGFLRGQKDAIGDLPDNVVETLKGLDVFEPDADYKSLPTLDESKDFTQALQGGEHVTHEGLIDMAHQDGLALTFTEPVAVPDQKDIDNHDPVIFRAVVATRRGVFMAYGDANPNDTMVDAVIRMAETRALSRALRQAVNIGATTAPEMPDSDSGVQVE